MKHGVPRRHPEPPHRPGRDSAALHRAEAAAGGRGGLVGAEVAPAQRRGPDRWGAPARKRGPHRLAERRGRAGQASGRRRGRPSVSRSITYRHSCDLHLRDDRAAEGRCLARSSSWPETGVVTAKRIGLRRRTAGWLAMPLFHSNAWFLGVMPLLWVGGAFVVRRRFTASASRTTC